MSRLLSLPPLAFHPLTPERWPDLERLFGPQGASSGCWCMWWRRSRAEFSQCRGEENRQGLYSLTLAGAAPGILAYVGAGEAAKAVGWCSVAPRADFVALERSRTLKRLDEQPVWSVVCFYVARGYRRLGLSTELIRAAVAYAASQGAEIVEAYPHVSDAQSAASSHHFMGAASAFARAGFVECARPAPHTVIMRCAIVRVQEAK